ncbi:MAG: FMN-binding protein [Blautia sp.]|nr:FMN-binding protein [Blautia sp.]
MADKKIPQKDFIKGLVAGIGSIVLVFALQGADVLTTNMAEAAKTKNMEAAGEFTPGTYTAEGQGINGPVSVSLTFNETNLTDAQIDASGETPDIGGAAAETLKEALVAAQSAQVEAVSGATITSDAVMEAAAKCFAEASGEEIEETAEEPAEEAEEAAEGEAAEEAAEGEAEAAEEAAEGEAEAEAADEEAAAAGGFIPGTYTGEAQGIESAVKVTLTVDETGITAAEIDTSGETQGIGSVVGEQVADAVVEAQGADFDGIAGATVTSDAVKAAVEAALAQAGSAQTAEAAETGEGEEAAGGLVPGTYTGEAQGIESTVKVTLTVDETGVTAAEIDTSGETQGIGSVVGEQVADAVVEAQGAGFDGIAGATVTSDAVKAAVEAALAQAAGGDAPAEEASSDDAQAASGGFVPGTYTGEAQGIESTVKVTLTIDETGITAAEIDTSGETQGIGSVVGEQVADAVVEAQGADFDGIAGATVTSDAVKTAVEAALAQAAA